MPSIRKMQICGSYSILDKDGNLDTKRLADALKLLESDLKFLQAELNLSLKRKGLEKNEINREESK